MRNVKETLEKGKHGEMRKHARTGENARAEIEKRLADILLDCGRAVAVVGSHMEILGANQECQQLLGYSAQDLVGKSALEITTPEDRPETRLHEMEIWSGRVLTYEMDKAYLRADGTPLRAHMKSFIINNDLGEPICEMEVIEPTAVFNPRSLAERLWGRVVAAFDFPETYIGLPV